MGNPEQRQPQTEIDKTHARYQAAAEHLGKPMEDLTTAEISQATLDINEEQRKAKEQRKAEEKWNESQEALGEKAAEAIKQADADLTEKEEMQSEIDNLESVA